MRETFTVCVAGGDLVGTVGGEGREVLLLHGGPGLSDYLASLVTELGPTYRVATYQQRGLMPSTARGPYDVPVQVDDVLAVLDHLGWDRPLVVGHSWGGHLLLHLLAAFPSRVAGALVVDPLGGVGDGGLAAFETELDRRTPEDVRQRARELDERGLSGTATEAEVLESLRLLWPAYFASRETATPMPDMRLSVEAYSRTFESILEFLPGLADRLRGCLVPTRFVHGERSPMPVSASSDIASLMGRPVDVIPGTGHFVWLEEPGSVRRSLAVLAADSASTER